jgi:hypothetical protein
MLSPHHAKIVDELPVGKDGATLPTLEETP